MRQIQSYYWIALEYICIKVANKHVLFEMGVVPTEDEERYNIVKPHQYILQDKSAKALIVLWDKYLSFGINILVSCFDPPSLS